MGNEIRIDKWLWTMRLFKTRSLAADYCKKGRVMMHGISMKPSHMVKEGDIIQLRRPPVMFSFRIIAISPNRLSAKFVSNFMENVTPLDQFELLEVSHISGFVDRDRGLGRPTKKERRDLDFFTDQNYADFLSFDDEDEE